MISFDQREAGSLGNGCKSKIALAVEDLL